MKRFGIWDKKEDAWCAIAVGKTSACVLPIFKDHADAKEELANHFHGNPRYEVRMIKVVVPGVAL